MKRLLFYTTPLLMILSLYLMVQSFVFLKEPIVHHAFIYTTIFVFSAIYAEKFASDKKTPVIISACIAFASFGMFLGLYEILTLTFAPDYTPQEICSSIFRA